MAITGLALAPAGCATGDELSQAAERAHSAIATVAVTVRAEAAGDSIPALSATVLKDALRSIADAQTTVSELELPDGTRRRDRTLSAIRQGTDAINAVRQALTGSGSLSDARKALAQAGARLSALTDRSEPAQ